MTTNQLPPPLGQEAQDTWQKIASAVSALDPAIPLTESLVDDLRRAFTFTNYGARQCQQHPDLLVDLLNSRDMLRTYTPEDYPRRLAQTWNAVVGPPAPQPQPTRAQDPAHMPRIDVRQDELHHILRLFRRREMVRIALRDIAGWADLDQTLADLSALADACINTALHHLHGLLSHAWGTPVDHQGVAQQLVVLGLGKLGARELNFSSDVDLVFAYPCEGQTRGGEKGRLGNEDFFQRLCRDLIKAIGNHTADGFVFRVDTRLRPFGEVGPLALSFDKLEDYYLTQGREWERYALIKARVVAGAQAAGRQVLGRLAPFVFRRYLDYGTFDALRDMKARIALEVRGKGLEDNIKLGSGGIREIEFFGQMFQLIRGGVDPALQIRPIRRVLAVLVKKRYIPAEVGRSLDEAYVFLRTLENRLQQWNDQQVHRLPDTPAERLRMAASLGFETWDALADRIKAHRQRVHAHFNELLAPKDPDPGTQAKDTRNALEGLWQGIGDDRANNAVLDRLGYREPDKILKLIASLREDRTLKALSPTGRERLNRLIPLVLEAVGQSKNGTVVLDRIFDLIKGIQRRTAYLALLLEHPAALTHLVRLSEASPWIAQFLSLHPVLLDELLDPRTLYRPPRRDEIQQELQQKLADSDPEDIEQQMEMLRVFKQVNVLRVAASDVTDVLPLMKVSDHLSDIAEILLEAVVAQCWQDLAKKYGTPCCTLDGRPCDRGFITLAYGKLGGLELGYGSDLDLVFLHGADPGETRGGGRTMENTLFSSRLGQRVLHYLTTHTSAGILYEADMRLRPSGTSGMLVSHINGFRDYQRKDAWTWEHQALIRARAISGDPLLKRFFDQLRMEILTQTRDPQRLQKEVAGMRARLRQAAEKPAKGGFDLKQGRGGIVDIEFLVQYLVLRHAHQHPQIVRWTDNVRQLQALNEAGVLDETAAFGLRRAYLLLRAAVHRLNLQGLASQVYDDRFEGIRSLVRRCWANYLGRA